MFPFLLMSSFVHALGLTLEFFPSPSPILPFLSASGITAKLICTLESYSCNTLCAQRTFRHRGKWPRLGPEASHHRFLSRAALQTQPERPAKKYIGPPVFDELTLKRIVRCSNSLAPRLLVESVKIVKRFLSNRSHKNPRELRSGCR